MNRPHPPEDQVSLAAVGDVFLGSLPENTMDKMLPILAEHDLRFCVLEGPVSDRGEPWPGKMSVHRSGASTMAAVKKARFDIVTLANNHILDLQRDAFLDTLELLDEHGIKYVGGGKDITSARKPVIIEKKGCRIAFLGYASFYPRGFQATETRPGIAQVRADPLYPPPHMDEEDLEHVLSNIRDTKEQADVVVVAYHWGISHTRTLTAYQKALGRQSIDAGADLVLGGHPHILQGIELYKGKVICYSFGNFVFEWVRSFADAPFSNTIRETMILTCLIRDNKVKGVYFRPVVINAVGDHILAEPEVVTADRPEFMRIFNTMSKLSAPLNAELCIEGDKIWVDMWIQLVSFSGSDPATRSAPTHTNCRGTHMFARFASNRDSLSLAKQGFIESSAMDVATGRNQQRTVVTDSPCSRRIPCPHSARRDC
jgi:poly-gamma-glutamate synthesis protein (capsule biosynthesis protein)